MATKTLAQLRLEAKRLANQENSDFVSDIEWDTNINTALAELYDLLVQASPPEYVATEQVITLVPGQKNYALPGDFRSLTHVFKMEGEYRRPMFPIGEQEWVAARPPQEGGDILVEYLPSPPVLLADADAWDFVSGWDRMVTAMAAKDAIQKEEGDWSALQNVVDREVQRVRNASANRDRGQPKIIGRRSEYGRIDAAFPWAQAGATIRYRLRGGNLEIYSL